MPKISVIIPLYNKGPYVRRALDSVLTQTFEDYELIVVDDGSTDESPDIVASYSDPRIRLIHQENAGPGAARNRGIREAQGMYVSFLDADDEWLPLFLEESLRVLSKHKTCDVSTSAYFLGENKTDISFYFRESGITDGEWEFSDAISNRDLVSCIFALHSCSTVCKRDLLLELGGFYSKDKCTYGEDYYLWIKVILNCKIYRILRPLWWYHIEDSEIGIRNSKLPLHPFMQNPDEIRAHCQDNKKALLERWFALYALHMAHEYLCRNQLNEVRFMIQNFPNMKRIEPLSYLKLLLKLKMPILRKN